MQIFEITLRDGSKRVFKQYFDIGDGMYNVWTLDGTLIQLYYEDVLDIDVIHVQVSLPPGYNGL